MQYKLLATIAFAATAFAQTTSVDYSSSVSVLSVLETALPSSLIAEAVTNSAAVSSQIASEFAEGSTPGWFQSLPPDVKTYLVPVSSTATATAASSGTAAATGASYGSGISTGSSGIMGGNTTAATAVTTGSLSSSSSSASTSSGSSAASATGSSSSSAGASMPTAMFGAGIAGVMGLVCLLAL
ncbi:hypothetical protein EJ03DRAFT_326032 [Teratosphaeria nubilosa]|uniref:GPI anchored protein n=1 Tax=Teratosphaeria nubilosa TaxID=161662 RepID=A0A6G1LDE6_9PEZI|nr:hypothetical protein EJ03DRAFT_326032 [Teratosphaeria nubilosa]